MRDPGGEKSLYFSWRASNLLPSASGINLFVLVAMFICAVFDPFFFGGEQGVSLYTKWRILPISICLFSYFVANRMAKSQVETKFLKKSSWASAGDIFLLITGTLITSLQYHYFLSIAPEPHRLTVLAGNALVIMFSAFVLHRYFSEYLILSTISALSTLYLQQERQDLYGMFLLVQITIAISIPAVWVLHRLFARSLLKEFKLVSLAVPPREAALIVTSENEEEWSHIFRPQERYCACIVADWRGYQSLIASRGSRTVEQCFNSFYGAIFNVLKEMIPSGTFYTAWTADELFLIIYDEADNAREVDISAAKVCQALASPIFNQVVPLLGLPIIYDIGATAGVGILGLQGPKGMKKTTVTSPHAGTAKRLESAAKQFRKEGNAEDYAPILLMQPQIAEAGTKAGVFRPEEISTVRVAYKDIDPEEEFAVFSINHDQTNLQWKKSGGRAESFTRLGKQ